VTKFFFEPDEAQAPQNDSFFDALESAGVIQTSVNSNQVQSFLNGGEQEAESLASMKRLDSRVLSVEYGTYRDNYAIHLTPIHPQKNLATDAHVRLALKELVLIMNEYVPYTLQVELFMPRDDWKMKVISAVIKNAAGAWNFDSEKFDLEAIPRIHAAVEAVCMGPSNRA
jgi:hypothetical protein